MQFRQFLKKLGKTNDGKKLLLDLLLKKKHKLNEEEFELLYYTFFEKSSLYTICNKLVMTEPTYYNHLKNAICKFEGLISDEEHRQITKFA